MRILVAEDQKPLARHICVGLKEAGFAVDLVHTGERQDLLHCFAFQLFRSRFPKINE